MNKKDIKIGDYVYTNWFTGYIIAKVLKIQEETIYGILELVSKLPEEKTDESIHDIELNTNETFLGHLNIDEINELLFEDKPIACCRLKYDNNNFNLENVKEGDYIEIKGIYNICKVARISKEGIYGLCVPIPLPTLIDNYNFINKKMFEDTMFLRYKRIGSYNYIYKKDIIKKLEFENEKTREYQQQILDKMTVLSCQINFSLDTGNKKAFEEYCKEYSKIYEELNNNNKMEVV